MYVQKILQLVTEACFREELVCCFDFKQFDRVKLKNDNPIIVPDKVVPL